MQCSVVTKEEWFRRFWMLNGHLEWSFAISPTARRPGMKHVLSNGRIQHTGAEPPAWDIEEGTSEHQRAEWRLENLSLHDLLFGRPSLGPGCMRHISAVRGKVGLPGSTSCLK